MKEYTVINFREIYNANIMLFILTTNNAKSYIKIKDLTFANAP